MKTRSRFYTDFTIRLMTLALLPALLSLACNLGVPPTTPTPIMTPTSAQKPLVTIQAPQDNADVVVGQAITVQATGTHPDGITRLELRANAQLADTKVSQNVSGDQQLSAYLNYTPSATGSLSLQVIAYHGNQASDPATVTVNVKDQAAEVTATLAAPAGATAVYNDPTCRALVAVNGLNFRQGPGTNYPPLAVIGLGTSIVVTGRLADQTWWQGRMGNTIGWMSAGYVNITGSLCSSVPIVLPPPSPVPTATFTNTTAPISATATKALPDLIVVKIEGPVSLVLGADSTQTATYKVTVQNIGPAQSGSFNVGMVLPDGTIRDMGAVSALAPTQLAIFQTNITFNAPGAVRLTAYVDMNQVVSETDESNNLKSYDVVLLKATSAPVTLTATTTSTVTSTVTATSTLTPTLNGTSAATP